MANYNYTSVEFLEQIKFFREKLNLPTARWDDILAAANDHAFVVAGATSAALLEDLHEALNDAIENGQTIQSFTKIFDEIVAKNGWTGWTGQGTKKGRAWRTRIIYETNIRTSYAAGRWQQDQEVKDEKPYLLYKHSDGVFAPRLLHLKWDGLVLPVDHVWWKTHYPPNGFGCKCQVFSLSKDDLIQRGLLVTPTNRIPPGQPDKGWDYAPGAEWEPDEKAFHPKINKSRKLFQKKRK